jgi:tetratricopeptide (TPR) repeat protein
MKAALLLVLALAIVGRAAADETATDATARAKALYQAGVLQYNLSEFQKALDDFKAAYELRPDPVLLFNIGQSHRMLGHPQEAVFAYRAYLRELPDAPNRQEVERLRAEMEREAQKKIAPTPPTGTIAPTVSRPQPSLTPETPPAPKTIEPPPAPTLIPAPAPTPPVAATSPLSVEPPRPTPLYKRWWLWTAVGGAVAVIAIGVGVGVGTAPGKDAPNPGGTLGSSGVRF